MFVFSTFSLVYFLEEKMKKIIFFLFCLFLVSGCNQYAGLTPKEVTSLYYESFAARDYKTMYALVSDGFKLVEPTAQTYDKFAIEMDRFYDSADEIRFISADESVIDGNSANVNYHIEVRLKSGQIKPFDSAFSLKKQNNGWKLIHPYGKNVDTSK